MSVAEARGVGSGRAYEAARLRWATESDTDRLVVLWHEAHAAGGPEEDETAESMHAWLEHGGALLLEDPVGRVLCAVRWRWDGDGWRVGEIVTRADARGQGFGRWLMTKVEALAIKRNVPTLTLALRQEERAGYYRRLGYRETEREEGVLTMVKRVGGTWQRQPGSAS